MRVYLSKYNWIILDLLGLCTAFIMLTLIPVDIASPVLYFTILLLFIALRRTKDLRRFAVASIIGVIWMFVAKDQYGYAGDYITLAGYNIFPLFMVPTALIGLWALYKAAHVIIPVTHFWSKLLLFVVFINWPIVILVEYAGYHWIGIQNSATAMYPGLAFCDCMHAPWWMQITYFSFGPLFFIASYFLNLHRHDDQP